MYKRNTIVTVQFNDTLRLARVKSVNAAKGTACITVALYKDCNVFSDCIVAITLLAATAQAVPNALFSALATCFPQKDLPNCPLLAQQRTADAQYPLLAALRNNYEPAHPRYKR